MKQLRSQKTLIVLTGLAVALLAFGGGYALSKRGKSTASGPIQTQCEGTCVALYDESADPSVVTVTAGSYVQFNVGDNGKHNLTLGDGDTHHQEIESYSSGDFEGDEAWRVQFKKDGTYSFKDKYHPKTYINVVVYTEGKDYKLTR